MSGVAAEPAYTLQGLRDMLGVSRNDVMGFIREGFVTPSRGPRNAYRFGFQDVVLMRTAQSLRTANISAAKVRKALKRLRTLLPDEMPLTGLRISALGDDIAVREDGLPVAADSGQMLFDFEVALTGGSVLSFPSTLHLAGEHVHAGGSHIAGEAAADFIGRGADAVDHGDDVGALAVYDAGVAAFPEDAALQFNRAIVLEDMGRVDEALRAYKRCLEIDAAFADAHWNLARLYELRGVQTLALRHFSAYRRLSR